MVWCRAVLHNTSTGVCLWQTIMANQVWCGCAVCAGIQRLATCLGKADVFGDKAISFSSGSPMSVATNA
jgi:hypothetical protein